MKSSLAGGPAGRFHAVGTVASWLLGFGLAAWLAGVCLPPAEPPPFVREKLRHLTEHGDEYDVIFLGSSRVQYHIMPSVFDRFAAGHGCPLKSFNAGVASLLPPENGYLLDQILRRPHARLRWVFIEMSAFKPTPDRQRIDTARFAYWHDWDRMILVTKRTLADFRQGQFSSGKRRRAPWFTRLAAGCELAARWLDHMGRFAGDVFNLGRGATLATRAALLAAPDAYDDRAALGSYGDGWSYTGDEHQQMTGEPLAEYERAYAEHLQTPSRKDSNDELSHEALDGLLARVVRAGAQPILIVPPTPIKRHYFPPPARERDLTIFDFSDVREYPELFKTENRQDIEHLNGAGAEIFTRILGQRFIGQIRPAP